MVSTQINAITYTNVALFGVHATIIYVKMLNICLLSVPYFNLTDEKKEFHTHTPTLCLSENSLVIDVFRFFPVSMFLILYLYEI